MFCSCCILIATRLMILTCFFFFFFKQKTAYEMRISDWSSDVCSSDLVVGPLGRHPPLQRDDRLRYVDRSGRSAGGVHQPALVAADRPAAPPFVPLQGLQIADEMVFPDALQPPVGWRTGLRTGLRGERENGEAPGGERGVLAV